MAEQKVGTLHDAMQGISFPATNEDIIHFAEKRGAVDVDWGHEGTINLRTIFLRYPHVTFLSLADVENAIHTAEATRG